MFLKNMEFFLLLLCVVFLISTSSVYGSSVNDISVKNDENLNIYAFDIEEIDNEETSNALDRVHITDYINYNEITDDSTEINEINSNEITDGPIEINDINSNEKTDKTTKTNCIALNITVEGNMSLDENKLVYATFDDLDKEIQNLQPGNTLVIDKDYYVTQDSKFCDIPITIATDNIIINGNGHTIDGRNMSAIFNVAGNNVRIYNLTFINGDYHSTRFNYELSPILWAGDYGVISACNFLQNKAIKGGAITWTGNHGLINDTLFENNFAYSVGGAIYLMGHDNEISNCTFTNSCSRLCGESIFSDCLNGPISITDNVFDNETFFNDCLSYTNIDKYYINGSKIGINVNLLSKSYISWVADDKIDLIPVIYLSIMNRYIFYNQNLIFYNEYNGTDFILNFIRDLGDGVTYTKSYHFYNLTSLNDIFTEAINGDFINNVSLIKNVIVKNKNDYENAIKTTIKLLSYIDILGNDLSSMDSIYLYKVLNVNFAGQYIINSKSTWKPKSSDFDMVKINGNGSTISVETKKSDEYKWVDLDDESSIFMVSDLTVEGFNMAVRNLVGVCIFNNVNFNNNKMDYLIEKDYGAGLCNAGRCLCTNCTFTNNYCKNGGAIFNQGLLELYNCSFGNNKAYNKGNDICNANDGIVIINDTQINGSSDIVVHVDGVSAKSRGFIFSMLSISSMALGFAFGSLVGSPAFGLLLGASAGAAVGALGGYLICTNTYDMSFDSVTAFSCIMVACTLSGAFGGAFGSFMGTEFPMEYESNIWAENELVIGPHGYPIHMPF